MDQVFTPVGMFPMDQVFTPVGMFPMDQVFTPVGMFLMDQVFTPVCLLPTKVFTSGHLLLTGSSSCCLLER